MQIRGFTWVIAAAHRNALEPLPVLLQRPYRNFALEVLEAIYTDF